MNDAPLNNSPMNDDPLKGYSVIATGRTEPPSPRRKAKRFRLNVELTPEQHRRLSSLEGHAGLSKAEVIRDALRLYCYAAELTLSGGAFRAVDKNGRAKDVIVLELLPAEDSQ